MRVAYKKKKIEIPVVAAKGQRRIFGLMFRTRKTENLLFSFPEDTDTRFHSLFVFFPFLMLWLDEKNRVLEWRIISPFSTAIRAENKFRKVVEIPCHPWNEQIIKIFVDNGKI